MESSNQEYTILLLSNMFLSINSIKMRRLMLLVFLAVEELKKETINIKIEIDFIIINDEPFSNDIFYEYIQYKNSIIPQKKYRKYDENNLIYNVVRNIFYKYNNFTDTEILKIIKEKCL